MAIADINKIQALYATQPEAELNAWKVPFQMANAFADTAEHHRRLDENNKTKDWRVAYANALAKTNVAKQQADLTQLQGWEQGLDFLKKHAVDEQGRIRNPEELLNKYRQFPTQQQNPYLFAQLLSGDKNYLTETAKNLAPINPSAASQYSLMAGVTPHLLDENNQVQNFFSGENIGVLPNNVDPAAVAGGEAWKYYFNQLANQQSQQKATQRALPDLTKPFSDVLTNSKQDMLDQKEGSVPALDPAKFRQNITQLYLLYPNQVDEINGFVERAIIQNGWPVSSVENFFSNENTSTPSATTTKPTVESKPLQPTVNPQPNIAQPMKQSSLHKPEMFWPTQAY